MNRLRAALQTLDATLNTLQGKLPRRLTPAEMLAAELRLPRNRNIIASVNVQTGEIGSVIINPRPTTTDAPIPLGDARRRELTQQLDALERIAQDGQSSPSERKRADIGAKQLRKLLGTVAA